MRTPANMVEQMAAAIAGVQLEAKRIDTGTTLQVNITEAQARMLAERIAATLENSHSQGDPAGEQAAAEDRADETIRPVRVEFSTGARSFLKDKGISQGQIEQIINQPEDTWLGHNPHAQDRPTVAVRGDHDYGVVYYWQHGEAYVISVRPAAALYQQRRKLTSGFRSSSSGGAGKKAIDSLETLISAARAQGLEFSRGSGHGKIYKPEAPRLGVVTVPSTPSDGHRAWKNTVKQINRAFGTTL